MTRTALNSEQMQSQDFSVAKPSTGRERFRGIFVGTDGIRAGWSALLFVVIFLTLSSIETRILSHFVSLETGGPMTPALTFLQELCDVFVVFLTTLVMARIEKRRLFSYGFTDTHKAVRLTSGVIWGLIALSLLIGVLWKSRLLSFDGFSLIGPQALNYGLAWAAVALLVGIFEESLLRGYLQHTLARGIGFWWAAVLLSAAFAVWHMSNGSESPLGLLVVGLGGLVFCLSLWYTKSLWWAIGFHAGWDWGQSYLYGTPDSGLLAKGHLLSSHPSGNPLWSGGVTGPEGSLLMVPMLIAMVIGMRIWWGKRQDLQRAGHK